MWEVFSFTVALAEGEHRQLSIDVEAEDHAIVLTEAADAPVEVVIGGLAGAENLSRSETISLFSATVRETGQLAVHLYSQATVIVRVTIARFVRRLRAVARRLPCRACKELVMLIVSALLAKLGVPFVMGKVVDISGHGENAIDSALSAILPPALDNLGLTGVIRGLLNGFGWVFQIRGRLSESACRMLGLCP